MDDAVEVEGTVVEISISEIESGRSGIEYDAQVAFTYQYQGIEYTSDQLYPGSFDATYDTRPEAESALDPYDDGDSVTAYIDPATPSEGFLQRQTSQGPLQFMAIGGLMLFVLTLNAVDTRKPGHGTELQPVNEHETQRYRTLFGANRETVNCVSKQLIKGVVVVLPLSLVGVVLVSSVRNQGREAVQHSGRSGSRIQLGYC